MKAVYFVILKWLSILYFKRIDHAMSVYYQDHEKGESVHVDVYSKQGNAHYVCR